MESLLPVINELQIVFKNVGIEEGKLLNLPQIVVVGSQSCGKSSVLESFVRKSFLPRGTGIVTRCPIIIQLNKIEKGQEEYTEFIPWGESANKKLFKDYDKLQEAIRRKTDEVAGINKGITNLPIIVRIFSPNVIPLTVVDLPGMVKIPVGDQPSNIEKLVMEMVKNYISNPNAIILAVSAGNVDLATSESLKIAKEVDPNGERTLAVVTKLDLLDKGVTAERELEGLVVPVKLGIVGVINRSQQDLNNNKSVENALTDETKKLEEQYPVLAGRIGSVYLAKRLNELLLDHIRKCLPDLKARIAALTEEQKKLLKTYGIMELSENAYEKMRLMTEVITKFEIDFERCVEDRLPLHPISETDSSVGSKIAMSIAAYGKQMQAIDGLQSLMQTDIEVMVKQATNWERLVSTEEVFKTLVKKQIRLLEPPCVDLCVQIHRILLYALQLCLKDGRVPKLEGEIVYVMRNLLDESLVQMTDVIKSMFEEHVIMIYTSDEEFNKLLRFGNTNGDLVAFLMSTEEGGMNQQQLTYMKKLVQTYFRSVQKNIIDVFPKRLMYIMYRQSLDKFQAAIGESTATNVDKLMMEPESIIVARKRALLLIKSLESAGAIVNKIQGS